MRYNIKIVNMKIADVTIPNVPEERLKETISMWCRHGTEVIVSVSDSSR